MPTTIKKSVKINELSNHKKHSCRPKSNRRHNTITVDLDFNEKLDVINIIDSELKGEHLPLIYGKKTTTYANNLLSMKQQPQSKVKADRIINNLKKSILIENKQAFNLDESKLLYRKFMSKD